MNTPPTDAGYGGIAVVRDLSLHVDDHHMGRVEDAHMVIMHMICYYFMDTEAPAEA